VTLGERLSNVRQESALDGIRDEAQREPIVVRPQDRDITVVLSIGLRATPTGNIQALLDLRNEVAAQAQ
jgi:hypothetical protein